MIRRLHLKNFRRHSDTELVFGPEDHLVAITGVNGAGKSSILEALVFAYFGESRNGRRGLDTLVSRGAELEGVCVEVDFELAGSYFKVQRKRVDGVPSALLFANGELVAESPSAVDAEMRSLLGMDSAGFKLAVFAKQKEVDGLTSLSRRERRRMLARLLRVDVVSHAANLAHEVLQREKAVLSSLGHRPDIDSQKAALAGAQKEFDALVNRVENDAKPLELLRAASRDAQDVEQRYHQAHALLERALGAYETVKKEVFRLETEIKDINIPPRPQDPLRDSQTIFIELENLLEQHAQARGDTEAVKAHRDLLDLHFEVTSRIKELENDSQPVELHKYQKALDGSRTSLTQAREELEVIRERLATARAQHQQILLSLEDLRDLKEPTCPTCGQLVDRDHLQKEVAALSLQRESTKNTIDSLEATFREAEVSLKSAALTFEKAQDELSHATAAEQSAKQAQKEIQDLSRRRDSYELRLTKEPPKVPDMEMLESSISACRKDLQDARAAESAITAHSEASATLESKKELLEGTSLRLHECEKVVTASRIPDDLDRDYKRAMKARAELQEHEARHAELRESLVRAEAAVLLQAERLSEAESFSEKYGKHEDQARISAYCKAVLKGVHQLLSTELRPSLEGALCQILSQVSDGRFSSARLDDDYEVTVVDDGKYRPLSELSGGESDLVALSLRLALSAVVSERSGTDALGLLILDEVFGSQDNHRRESILAALRELRSTYGQVFIISHVGGIEDAADVVVELHTGKDRKLTEVSVL